LWFEADLEVARRDEAGDDSEQASQGSAQVAVAGGGRHSSFQRAYTPTSHHPPSKYQTIRVKLDHALTGMRQQAQQEAARQQRRLVKLTDERTKLLHAYYQGAIPLDLLHQEQDRITTDTAAAEGQLALAERSTSDVQSTLDKALDLLVNCQHAYTRAPGHLRRQWNQALFLRLDVHDNTIEHADIAEPFATLTTPTLPDELDHHQHDSRQAARGTNTRTVASNGRGSNKNQIAGR
jgi:hypothetical protein